MMLPSAPPPAPAAADMRAVSPILETSVRVWTTWILFLVVRSAALNVLSVLITLCSSLMLAMMAPA